MSADEANNEKRKIISKKNTISYPRDTYWHSEEQLNFAQDYNESFKSAFQFSGIGMALMAPEGRLLDVNNAFCTFTGYSRPELLQMDFLQLGHPDDNHTDVALLHKMLVRLLNYYSLEKRYISKQKKILWGLHTVSKVLSKNGTLRFYVLQIVDITRRHQLADELSRKNSELEAIRSGLINKIGQMEELNHIIAHNLRGPANNIRMLVDMLKNIDEPATDTSFKLELPEIVNYLDEGAASLTGSLETLMDVVQISINKGIIHDECDVSKLISNILSQLNSTIYETKALITLSITVRHITYPSVFLESIFYNLISNALKYISKERTPEVTISTYSAGGRNIISVKDNGLGINLEKYGKKLFKLNQVFHPGHDSKGVGLFLTRAQIESFGGSIEVKSQEHVGSEFIVTL
jgi:PAS domain S-box-containing protein